MFQNSKKMKNLTISINKDLFPSFAKLSERIEFTHQQNLDYIDITFNEMHLDSVIEIVFIIGCLTAAKLKETHSSNFVKRECSCCEREISSFQIDINDESLSDSWFISQGFEPRKDEFFRIDEICEYCCEDPDFKN